MHGVSETDWATIQALFEDLVDFPPDEQERRLKRSTQPSAIVSQTEALLAAARADGILDMATPSIDLPGGPTGYRSLAEGQIVGGFTVDRLIGRGGMGEVYLAHRTTEDFEQRVALKMLRAEASDRGDMFARERRLLARLEHPGIARLIDAGIAEDGRPFMAMEYVDGEPIDIWCRTHKADLDTRLTLFRNVCEAVSYAHGHLVIHRDIKPSNIVIEAGGKPRLLDFGIAKLLDDTAAVPIVTQAMLTPEHAAPSNSMATRRRSPPTSTGSAYCCTNWSPASAPGTAKARRCRRSSGVCSMRIRRCRAARRRATTRPSPRRASAAISTPSS
ncbi:serine/threonine-protein kinase [Sphingomonas psychrotolerans]|nr:serine/threonine-protein kinase [Sphingomonas psychrotolerans]